jgi:hypothetical protein
MRRAQAKRAGPQGRGRAATTVRQRLLGGRRKASARTHPRSAAPSAVPGAVQPWGSLMLPRGAGRPLLFPVFAQQPKGAAKRREPGNAPPPPPRSIAGAAPDRAGAPARRSDTGRSGQARWATGVGPYRDVTTAQRRLRGGRWKQARAFPPTPRHLPHCPPQGASCLGEPPRGRCHVAQGIPSPSRPWSRSRRGRRSAGSPATRRQHPGAHAPTLPAPIFPRWRWGMLRCPPAPYMLPRRAHYCCAERAWPREIALQFAARDRPRCPQRSSPPACVSGAGSRAGVRKLQSMLGCFLSFSGSCVPSWITPSRDHAFLDHNGAGTDRLHQRDSRSFVTNQRERASHANWRAARKIGRACLLDCQILKCDKHILLLAGSK